MESALISEIGLGIALWCCLVRLVLPTRGPEWCFCVEVLAARGPEWWCCVVATRWPDAFLSHDAVVCTRMCGLIVGNPAGMFQCQLYPVVLFERKINFLDQVKKTNNV